MGLRGRRGIACERGQQSVPAGRLGQPAEVADLIVAVAQNAYMTAQTVSVDGGRYPR